MDYSLPGSLVHGDSPGKNTGVGLHAILKGIVPPRNLTRISSLPPEIQGKIQTFLTITNHSVQSFSSCPTFCDSMDYSTPGFPVLHQLRGLAQTHVHRVGDAIQPSHPLWSPSPPAFNLPSIRVFSNESVRCIRWPKFWSFSFNISPSNEYSGLISLSNQFDYCLDLLADQGTIKSLLKHQSSKTSILQLSL